MVQLLNKVQHFIEYYHLLNKDALYIVALSGGADSVCLLKVLTSLGYHVEAAHCNFHLRGEESDRDETFCKEISMHLGVTLHLVHFDTREYAQLHKVSIEMAARELRYNYFEQLRRDIEAEGICVAHHRDDSVETVVMNLMRGTGLQGLKGIDPKNGRILRPLLCVSRKEIEKFVTGEGLSYVTDSTNLEEDALRNKIRLSLLPMMEKIIPAARENINRTAGLMREANLIVEDYQKRSVEECIIENEHTDELRISIPQLLHQVSPEYTLYPTLLSRGFSSAQIRDIYSGLQHPRTGSYYSSSTHELTVHGNEIVISKKDDEEYKPLRIPETGTYIIDNNQKIKLTIQAVNGSFSISRSADIATLDADKIKFPLTLRRVADGDRFVPFGMQGSKLVSDFLTDRHMTILDKRRQLVLADATDKIIWLVGLRPSQQCAITSTSKQALVIKL